MNLETLLSAIDDPDSGVRSAAFRITDSLPAGPMREAAAERMIQRAPSVRGEAQIALLCSLGNIGTPAADAAMRFLLMTGPATPLRQDAAIKGKQPEFSIYKIFWFQLIVTSAISRLKAYGKRRSIF